MIYHICFKYMLCLVKFGLVSRFGFFILWLSLIEVEMVWYGAVHRGLDPVRLIQVATWCSTSCIVHRTLCIVYRVLQCIVVWRSQAGLGTLYVSSINTKLPPPAH